MAPVRQADKTSLLLLAVAKITMRIPGAPPNPHAGFLWRRDQWRDFEESGVGRPWPEQAVRIVSGESLRPRSIWRISEHHRNSGVLRQMARVTVEDCIDKIDNRFDLVLLAAHRARLISSGQPLLVDRDRDKNPVVALREIADSALSPDDLSEDFIHSLQRHVEVDEPEAEAAPALNPTVGDADFDVDAPFDRMTEEDLLRGLEGLVPPAEVEEDGE